MRSLFFCCFEFVFLGLFWHTLSVKIPEPSEEQHLLTNLLAGYNPLILPTPNNSISVKVCCIYDHTRYVPLDNIPTIIFVISIYQNSLISYTIIV